jgi:hypothetical protein
MRLWKAPTKLRTRPIPAVVKYAGGTFPCITCEASFNVPNDCVLICKDRYVVGVNKCFAKPYP